MSDFLVNLARRSLGAVLPGTLAPAPLPLFPASMELGEQAGDAASSVARPFQSITPASTVEALPSPARRAGPLSQPGLPHVLVPDNAAEPRPTRSESTLAPARPQLETGPTATHNEEAAALENSAEIEPSEPSVSAALPASALPVPADRTMPSPLPVEQVPKTLSAAVPPPAPGRPDQERPRRGLVKDKLLPVAIEPRERVQSDARVTQKPAPPKLPPVQVRIGSIEVRVTKPSLPPAPRPAAPAPAGFDGYLSARNYLDRGW